MAAASVKDNKHESEGTKSSPAPVPAAAASTAPVREQILKSGHKVRLIQTDKDMEWFRTAKAKIKLLITFAQNCGICHDYVPNVVCKKLAAPKTKTKSKIADQQHRVIIAALEGDVGQETTQTETWKFEQACRKTIPTLPYVFFHTRLVQQPQNWVCVLVQLEGIQ
jgi:hypothetical protein